MAIMETDSEKMYSLESLLYKKGESKWSWVFKREILVLDLVLYSLQGIDCFMTLPCAKVVYWNNYWFYPVAFL